MGPMSTYAVEYTYTDDADALSQVRPSHRAYLGERLAEGTLIASGPYTAGPAGALLLFSVADEQALQEVLDGDPFAVAGLISATSVRPWNPVFAVWDKPA